MTQNNSGGSFAAHLNMEVDGLGDGRARSTLVVDGRHLNPHGTAHGALLYSIVGSALAAAANDDVHSGVVSAVHIDYVAPAYEGDTLVAVAEVTERLQREDLFTIRLTRQSDGQVIARASARATRRRRNTETVSAAVEG